ncbi:HIT family protein [Streptomyces telluris]|uniref:HIT family protein n=1 Tax=Streptomyces telluris TaxID=2720021 RepID=A0A9X2LL73_9ACTN|nr:HIT family protein [Streptomyces telluris]MCQ8773163.1 HIT family protein [Streptomyces telluris]
MGSAGEPAKPVTVEEGAQEVPGEPADRAQRQPMDLAAYSARAQSGPCFVCAFLSGDPDFAHETVFEDDEHVAFLDRWPTLPGKVLVAPKAHVEHVVRDLDETAYLRLMRVVHTVALAVERVFAPERTYLLSLGSRQGNAHLHWHIAGLPPGVPYDQQQFHALMSEHGVLTYTSEQRAEMAAHLRRSIGEML